MAARQESIFRHMLSRLLIARFNVWNNLLNYWRGFLRTLYLCAVGKSVRVVRAFRTLLCAQQQLSREHVPRNSAGSNLSPPGFAKETPVTTVRGKLSFLFCSVSLIGLLAFLIVFLVLLCLILSCLFYVSFTFSVCSLILFFFPTRYLIVSLFLSM